MLSQEVAKKYARALYLAAEGKGLMSQAYEQFNALKQLVAKDDTLVNFMTAPQVLDEHKITLLRQVFSSRLEPLFLEFLLVLVDKKRINYLPEIIDEFDRMVEAAQGIGRVTVTTALPLNDGERSRLQEKLAAKTGLKIVLEEKVQPGVIGGMIVILHDEIVDGSISHSLNQLEELLGHVRVH